MHKAGSILLLAHVIQGCSTFSPQGNRATDMQHPMEKLVDKLAAEVFDKLGYSALKVCPHSHRDLDGAMLGKPENLFAKPHGVSPFSKFFRSGLSVHRLITDPSLTSSRRTATINRVHARTRLPRGRTVMSSSGTTETRVPVDMSTFVKELSEQPVTEVRGPVDFLKYEDKYVFPAITGDPTGREVLLYIPGLDFAGISACGTFPSLASHYELWRCRVASSDRSFYSDLADIIAGFVEDQTTRGRNVTLMGESFGGLLAVGVAQRLVERHGGRAMLAGVILVNPATSYDRSPISLVGPALTQLPAERFDIPILPDAQVMRGNAMEKLRPQVSLYGIAAGALLGVTVPSVPQIIRGIQGLLDDASSSVSPFADTAPNPTAVVEKLASGASAALVSLDNLALRLTPATLSWRLRNWLAMGCAEVNPRLKKLKDQGVPVLVLAGDQDRLLPSEDEARRLERELGPRTCQAAVLKEMGHAVLIDGHVDILKFIKESTVWN